MIDFYKANRNLDRRAQHVARGEDIRLGREALVPRAARHVTVVTQLIAANALVDKAAANDNSTPL